MQDVGTAIFEQGDAADCIYVMLEGRATVTIRRNDKNFPAQVMRPGCIAGGVAAFVGIPHRGTVSWFVSIPLTLLAFLFLMDFLM